MVFLVSSAVGWLAILGGLMELKGQEGELKFTIEITRAATGEKQTVDLVGKIVDAIEESEEFINEEENT